MTNISELNSYTTPLGFSTTKVSNLVMLVELIDGKPTTDHTYTRFYNMRDFTWSYDDLCQHLLIDIEESTYDGEAWIRPALSTLRSA
jgi:hypothetical protein